MLEFLSTVLPATSPVAPIMLALLLLITTVDFVLGSLASWRMGIMNSSIGREGTSRKMAMMIGIFLIVVLEVHVFATLGIPPVAWLAVMACLVHEIQSVVENLARCGADFMIPKPMIQALEKARGAHEFYQAKRDEKAAAQFTLVPAPATDAAEYIDRLKAEDPTAYKLLLTAAIAEVVQRKNDESDQTDEITQKRRTRTPRLVTPKEQATA